MRKVSKLAKKNANHSLEDALETSPHRVFYTIHSRSFRNSLYFHDTNHFAFLSYYLFSYWIFEDYDQGHQLQDEICTPFFVILHELLQILNIKLYQPIIKSKIWLKCLWERFLTFKFPETMFWNGRLFSNNLVNI